jgi:hypothetical protein
MQLIALVPKREDAAAGALASGKSTGPNNAERRIAQRFAAALIPSITGLRLSPSRGKTVLVNISTSGLVAKGDSRWLPGTAVTVVLEGTFLPTAIKGRVARCQVGGMDGGLLWYDIGIAFDKPILLEVPHQSDAKKEAVLPALEDVTVPAVLFNRW